MDIPDCFVAGTLVASADGNVAIETIKKGDYVWANNPETGETALKQVVDTFVSQTTYVTHITVNGETITSTQTHPYYVVDKGWILAGNLRAGDILVMLNGEHVVLELVQHEILESPVKVYNFEVEDFHTYYVGEESVLVHNSCAHKSSEWKSTKSKYWKDAAANKKSSVYYELTDDNLSLMAKGKAPVGIDGYKVQLHHTKGIGNDMKDIYAISRTDHINFHKKYGYKNFIDIRLTEFWR